MVVASSLARETGKAQWQLMGAMHEHGYQMQGMFGAARAAAQRLERTLSAETG